MAQLSDSSKQSSPDALKNILEEGKLGSKFLDKNIITKSDEIPLPLTDDESLRKLRVGLEDLPPEIVNSGEIFEKLEALMPEDEKIEAQFDSPYDLSFERWQNSLKAEM